MQEFISKRSAPDCYFVFFQSKVYVKIWFGLPGLYPYVFYLYRSILLMETFSKVVEDRNLKSRANWFFNSICQWGDPIMDSMGRASSLLLSYQGQSHKLQTPSHFYLFPELDQLIPRNWGRFSSSPLSITHLQSLSAGAICSFFQFDKPGWVESSMPHISHVDST